MEAKGGVHGRRSGRFPVVESALSEVMGCKLEGLIVASKNKALGVVQLFTTCSEPAAAYCSLHVFFCGAEPLDRRWPAGWPAGRLAGWLVGTLA